MFHKLPAVVLLLLVFPLATGSLQLAFLHMIMIHIQMIMGMLMVVYRALPPGRWRWPLGAIGHTPHRPHRHRHRCHLPSPLAAAKRGSGLELQSHVSDRCQHGIARIRRLAQRLHWHTGCQGCLPGRTVGAAHAGTLATALFLPLPLPLKTGLAANAHALPELACVELLRR